MKLEQALLDSWYGGKYWSWLLLPLWPVVAVLVAYKRRRYLSHKTSLTRPTVPVIVVGNLTVGGTGKSPMVMALCRLLKEKGYQPGIVSRGYGVSAPVPRRVSADSDPFQMGDEPVMLASRTQCPLAICSDRLLAAQLLCEQTDVDVIVSDDGLQHYGMTRDIEIVMLDAKRGLGNGFLLPVGPLREPVSRLHTVDFAVTLSDQSKPSIPGVSTIHTVDSMPLVADCLVNLATGEIKHTEYLAEQNHWHVCAGIGNPSRFLATLQSLGMTTYQSSWHSDHHRFQSSDIPSSGPVVMTEKDAVKCRSLSLSNKDVWFLRVSLTLSQAFSERLLDRLQVIEKRLGESKHE